MDLYLVDVLTNYVNVEDVEDDYMGEVEEADT